MANGIIITQGFSLFSTDPDSERSNVKTLYSNAQSKKFYPVGYSVYNQEKGKEGCYIWTGNYTVDTATDGWVQWLTGDGKFIINGKPISIDNILNINSENPVQNKVITTKINTIDSTIETIKRAINYLGPSIQVKGIVDSVQNLPEKGIPGDLYLVKKQVDDGLAENYYDEYLWVQAFKDLNNTPKWELIGTTGININDYVKKTEFNTAITSLENTKASKDLATPERDGLMPKETFTKIDDLTTATTPFGSNTYVVGDNLFEKGSTQTIKALVTSRIFKLKVTPYSDGNNASLGATGTPITPDVVEFTLNGVTSTDGEIDPNDKGKTTKEYSGIKENSTIYTTVKYRDDVVERNVSYYFNYPSYYGTLHVIKDAEGTVIKDIDATNFDKTTDADNDIISTDEKYIKALEHREVKSGRYLLLSNSVSLNDELYCYAYPASYGGLSSVQDATQDITSEFRYEGSPIAVKFRMPIDLTLVDSSLTFEEDLAAHPDNYIKVPYLVYIKKNKITNSGLTFKFS